MSFSYVKYIKKNPWQNNLFALLNHKKTVMASLLKFILSMFKFITVLWLSSRVMTSVAIENGIQIIPAADDDCIQNDLSAHYIMSRALERSVLSPKRDLFSLISRVSQNHRAIPPISFDYANMIQNDVILLGDSIETQTRKRGSVLIPPMRRNDYIPANNEHMCNTCEARGEPVDLGPLHFPRYVYQKTCNQNHVCSGLYECRPIVYDVKILTVKPEGARVCKFLPRVLQDSWTLETKSVTVACLCTHPGPN